MTCIIGLVHNNKVYIAGDSAGSKSTGDVVVRRDPKVFKNGEFIIGGSGSFRAIQILRNHLQLRPLYNNEDLTEYMETEFVESMRGALRHFGSSGNDEGSDVFNGNYLVGVRDRLFNIGPDYQVGELYMNFDSVGSGDSFAKGSLYSTETSSLTPVERIEMAMQAATEFNAGVRGPYLIISNDDAPSEEDERTEEEIEEEIPAPPPEKPKKSSRKKKTVEPVSAEKP